jgi:hypothetical protein
MQMLSWFWAPLAQDMLIEVLGSLLFLFLVLMVYKPWINISPFVCKNNSDFPGEGMVYFIKFVNISFFTAHEIKVELSVIERYPTPPSGMMNKRMLPLALISSNHSHIAGYRPTWWRNAADHCIRFRTKENLDNIIRDPFKSVEVQVTLKHGLTGLLKVFTKEYSDIYQIKEGKFHMEQNLE